MAERSLQHRDPDSKDDETLRREARVHLASEPALQLVAELIARLRELDLPWWTPVKLRERWGAIERMGWFRERSDIRQQITTSLTGLSPRAARRKTPDFQGSLIDSVIDEGDITPRAFEAAFDPRDVAVYGPASAYWHFFCESMPWDQDTTVHQEIVAWLLKALLADRSHFEGIGRTPILTPWDVRTAIDGRLWQTRIPLEVRVAIDNARLQQERERPGVPFHADGELAICGPDVIAANIPPREILPVVQLAQRAMRFDAPRGAQKVDAPKASTPELSSAGRAGAPGASAGAAGAPASSPASALSAAATNGNGKPGAGAASTTAAPSFGSLGAAVSSAAGARTSSPSTPPSAPKPITGAATPLTTPPAPPGAAPAGSASTAPTTPPPFGASSSASGTRPSFPGSPSLGAAEPPRGRLPSDPGLSSRPSSPPGRSAPPPPPAPSIATTVLSDVDAFDLDDSEEEGDEGEGERTGQWAVSGSEPPAADLADSDAEIQSDDDEPLSKS